MSGPVASLRVAADPVLADRLEDPLFSRSRSVRVSTAAKLLDADESLVRTLLRDGDLEGHRIGTRGVRIYVSSIETYQQRGRLQKTGGNKEPKRQPPRKPSAAHREALASLHELGIFAQDASRPDRRRNS